MIVSNASPLIVFSQIGRLALVEATLGEIWVPPAVVAEIRPTVGPPPPWTRVTDAPRSPLSVQWQVVLDRGEREVIAVALAKAATLVLLDDRQARREAKRLGLAILGSVGVVLEAHRTRLIDDVGPVLDAMLGVDFHLSAEIYGEAIAIARSQRGTGGNA